MRKPQIEPQPKTISCTKPLMKALCQGRHWVWGLTNRRAIKEETMAIYCKWVYSQTCRLSHNVHVISHCFTVLTHLNRMNFPSSINRTNLFLILGVIGGIFHIYSKVHLIFCKQTVKTLIRRRFIRQLIWVCTVCLCPTKKDTRLIWVDWSGYIN